jgi:hypothetical protein
MMIVDDRVVLIGSANLTDRSLVGYQDSEVLSNISLHQCRSEDSHSLPFFSSLPLLRSPSGLRTALSKPSLWEGETGKWAASLMLYVCLS